MYLAEIMLLECSVIAVARYRMLQSSHCILFVKMAASAVAMIVARLLQAFAVKGAKAVTLCCTATMSADTGRRK